jgi:hypothetical protein
MRNAEHFPDQPADLTPLRPTVSRLGTDARTRPWFGRIRYAHGGTVPPGASPRPVSPAEPGPEPSQHEDREDARSAGTESAAGFGEIGTVGGYGEPWSARFPVASRNNDVWVLVCGGIAAAAAFAAAFVATGGVATHAATPATVPAVVSQACPVPAARPAP